MSKKQSISNGANQFRKDFPILATKINGKPLVYLDNAATAHKPQQVLDAVNEFYTTYNANIHRGIHTLSQKATEAVDDAREIMRRFIGAERSSEVLFTYGTTFSINFVAYAWAERFLKSGDEIVLSVMEHHANTVPWLELQKRKRIKLSFVPLTKNFELDYDAMRRMVSKKTKLISLAHISNVLGTENDIPRIVSMARRVGAKVLIDAAQSVAREKIEVNKWNVDFFAFSGHKMYAPTGSGVLYVKKDILKTMPPFLGGGGAIIEVTQRSVTYRETPDKFEAGTPHIAGNIGLGAAATYIMKYGIATMKKSEMDVARYAYDKLSHVSGVRLFCHARTHGVLSFTMEGVHPHDIAEILNTHGVAIRAGFHCAMPLHTHLKTPATARISLACYNTKDEIDVFIKGLKDVQNIFKQTSSRPTKSSSARQRAEGSR
ncbi:MAG: SufS family cysteine desulfurase [Patescibacteria group bacterium]